MEWTGLNELREKYLAFFESKGHLRLPSFSLIPQGDPSLLLIGAGMAPMKKYFTGELTPPCVRVVTCQKCVRTVDIDNVGITDRHGTYFEMLGNFSFGEYFKREATAWAWEFFTEVLKMDREKLYVTVFTQDDEAWDIWAKEVGVAREHIVRLDDNFWEHGEGPCGPDSEIFYDRGIAHGCGSPDCAPGCDCDRYIEVWNLVFTQFNNDGAGNYTELESKNIDTGMGLERLACVVQGVDNLFEVDTIRRIREHISRIAGVQYHADAKKDVSLRIVTDHIRATTMMISDGVLPSNEGRGYVLRRLLRRAARHGRLLGIGRLFLSEVAETVIQENAGAYPALNERRGFILRVIAVEEENFSRTIDAGMQLLGKMIDHMENAAISGADPLAPVREAVRGHITSRINAMLSGADAFKLSDTYGFPIDLIREILSESGMKVDEDGYKALMKEQRERSRAARKEAGGWDGEAGFDTGDLPPTQFLGYDLDECEATILAIEGNIVILDKTPFYAESGGQCGDAGIIGGSEVIATTKTTDGIVLHHCEDARGLRPGDTVRAAVVDRRAIRANHTAAHLLHAALRRVLGNHVEQAGQSVTPEHVRFDFTHFAALTKDELQSVENLVNEAIWKAMPVKSKKMPLEKAKKYGAMALFSEKYGDIVRVVYIKEPKVQKAISSELCGGTHAANTGNLGMFRILGGDSSVASGVRRITAVTAANAYDLVTRMANLLSYTAGELKIQNSEEEYKAGLQAVITERKELKRENAQLKEKLSAYAMRELLQGAKEIGGVRFVSGVLECDVGGLRQACDIARASGENAAALFACKTDKGLQFAAACAPGAVKAGAHAGNIAKAAAQAAGGSGGGRPDSAMAGGKDPAKLGEALAAGEAALRSMLKC